MKDILRGGRGRRLEAHGKRLEIQIKGAGYGDPIRRPLVYMISDDGNSMTYGEQFFFYFFWIGEVNFLRFLANSTRGAVELIAKN